MPPDSASPAAAARLAALDAAGLLDTPPEAEFDALAVLARETLGVTSAFVTLVAADRQYCKSAVTAAGAASAGSNAPLAHSYCQTVVRARAVLQVDDAAGDPAWRDHPGTAAFGIGAYLRAPVTDADGFVLGSLCVTEPGPRAWTGHDARVLAALAAAVSREVALRGAHRRLATREADLADLLAHTEELSCRTGPDGRLTYVNAAWVRALGYAAEEAAARRPVDFVAPEDRDRYLAAAHRLAAGESVRDFEATLLARDGRRVACRGWAAPIMARGPDGRPTCVGTRAGYRDVTLERRAEAAGAASEAKFREVLENLRAFAVQLDTAGRVTFMNDALLAATGWSREEVVGTDYFDRFLPDGHPVRAIFAATVAAGTADGVPAHYENEILTRRGARRLVAWDNVVLRGPEGHVVGTASVGRDVTHERGLAAERERLLAVLADQAEHDELTGLVNRRGFRRMAAQERRTAARTGRRDAVCYVDLDRFKAINDTFGHAAGDAALVAVAQVLRTTMRDADFAARLGGDEFAIYAVGLVQPGDGESLAERLRAALAAHNAAARAAGRPHDVAFSVGTVELRPGEDLDAALARADAQLYAAKRPGPDAPLATLASAAAR